MSPHLPHLSHLQQVREVWEVWVVFLFRYYNTRARSRMRQIEKWSVKVGFFHHRPIFFYERP